LIRWLVLLVLALAATFWLVTDAQPLLSRDARIGMPDLQRGKAIVDSLGLRRMREGEARQLVLTEADLDTGVNYLAHRLARGSADVEMTLSELLVRASVPLPGLGRYVNLRLTMMPGETLLRPTALRIGKLRLPADAGAKLVLWGLARSPYSEDLAAARALLDSARISGQTLALRFTWRGAAVRQMLAGEVVAQGVDEAILQDYRDRLGKVRGNDFPMLLGEMFALAAERSKSADPVVENRAVLTILAEKALGSRLLSRQAIARTDRRTAIKLAGRNDFAQHFAVSAFLAATGGEHFSEMVGLYKELQDAQGGSGFSFNDLAADRAGSKFGETATRSRAAALRMQQRLAGTRDAGLFFPRVDDLPEFLNQAEFQRRYGGVDQPAYRKMRDKIDQRIAGLGIYQS
jgi:uncharacterized protein YfiM (DUF2279 family)